MGLLVLLPLLAAAEVPNDVCAECHTDIGAAFPNTPHGVYFHDNASLAKASCESCHGSGLAHIADGDPSKILNPAGADQFSNVLCLECHKSHQFDDWAFSAHNGADVNCSACHSVHGEYHGVTKKPTPELCYDCHSSVRAATNMPSHHPIKEGKLQCQDCHAVHGGQARLTMENTGRELCFSCHADKEGPFVYEHAPVNEDCMICHTPHGSVADNLLKQNEPALCLGCHPMHFHATVIGVDGEFTVPLASDRNGVSTPDAWKKGMLTKCTQCHSEIHGTDLPSQAISTGGNSLTR